MREDAWAAACEIGWPVVIKPRDGNQGKGVAANVEIPRTGARRLCRRPRVSATDVMVEQSARP